MVLFMIISVKTQARSMCLCYSQFIIGELKQFTNKCLIKFLDMWLQFSFTIWYSWCIKAKISVKSIELFYILFSTYKNFRKLEIKFSVQYFKGCCFTYLLSQHFIPKIFNIQILILWSECLFSLEINIGKNHISNLMVMCGCSWKDINKCISTLHKEPMTNQ